MRTKPTTRKPGLAVRLERANRFLTLVAGCGRQFFYSPRTQQVARLELRKGFLYYVSPHRGSSMFVHYEPRGGYQECYFGEGGTMWSLLLALRDYVRSDAPFPIGHLGPAPKWMVNDGDIWGYGPDVMENLRTQTRALLAA